MHLRYGCLSSVLSLTQLYLIIVAMRRPTRLLSLALSAVLSLQAVVAQGSHRFRIKSMADNSYAGISPILPAWQSIHTGGPITDWRITKVEGNQYHFSVGGYPYVGIIESEVIASVHQEQDEKWLLERRDSQGGYTISPASKPHLGWTKPEDSRVDISPLLVMPSDPPRFLPSQLWLLEPINE